MKKIRKRYILLIVLTLFPFYRLIHTENYCFGDVDLVIIAMLTILYIIAFLSIFFYNLYKISLKKELFNFRPLIITFFFSMSLYYSLEYHDKNIFEGKPQVFNSYSKEKATLEINLYKNKTFELKTINPKSFCVEKGTYHYKQDTLFLNKRNNVDGNINFGDVYTFNKTFQSLNPIYSGLPTFVLKK
jgi:amino acid transporter